MLRSTQNQRKPRNLQNIFRISKQDSLLVKKIAPTNDLDLQYRTVLFIEGH
jgi:hypothetical protein